MCAHNITGDGAKDFRRWRPPLLTLTNRKPAPESLAALQQTEHEDNFQEFSPQLNSFGGGR